MSCCDKRTHDDVSEYYGRVLQSSSDLQTDLCCSVEDLPHHHRELLANVPTEVLEKFYGCGSPIPHLPEGCTVLDLGCGTGRDAFICAQLVGDSGKVIGIDMTDEQLAVAQKYERPNTRFLKGYMEDLSAVGIEDNSVDVVISNCVINLSPKKEQVFAEIFRVLKPGGELYFSDVFADRRIPRELQQDSELLGECLAGAMYTEDFRRMLQRTGVPDHRIISMNATAINNPELENRIGFVNFTSTTVRAFKLASLEDRCEDFGQVAVYKGTIPHHPHRFEFDNHHLFETGHPMLVCGNTAAMISETRYAPHFQVTGDRSRHFGLFDCADGIPFIEDDGAGGCC